MLAVMVSKWVADAINKDGIYDEHIGLNGYPFLDNKRDYRFSTQAIDVMSTRDLCMLTEAGHTIGDLRGLLTSRKYAGFPIVNNSTDMNVRGYITRAELRAALDRATTQLNMSPTTICYFSDQPPSSKSHGLDMSSWMDAAPLTVVDHTTTNIVYDLFKKMGLRVVLVVAAGRLVGVITKKDVLRHLPKTKKK
jgi:chloride channel 3/4/5